MTEHDSSTPPGDEEEANESLLAVLAHDPSWSWLHDAAEDMYTEDDISGER